MDQKETSPVSEDTTATIMLEQDKDSEVSTGQHTAEPPASISEAQDENQLVLFVTMLTVKVLTKSNILQNLSRDAWVAQTKHLVNQTMEKLTAYKDFCPDMKSNKKVCKAVLKDLKKKFKDKHLLESMILQQDPSVEEEIVWTFKVHIIDLAARQKKKPSSRWDWIDALHAVALGAAVVATVVLMIVFP